MNNRSLLEELVRYIPNDDKITILQTKGVNAVSALLNFLEYADNSFSTEEVHEITKKILLAIKNRDIKKFEKSIVKSYQETKNENK